METTRYLQSYRGPLPKKLSNVIDLQTTRFLNLRWRVIWSVISWGTAKTKTLWIISCHPWFHKFNSSRFLCLPHSSTKLCWTTTAQRPEFDRMSTHIQLWTQEVWLKVEGIRFCQRSKAACLILQELWRNMVSQSLPYSIRLDQILSRNIQWCN